MANRNWTDRVREVLTLADAEADDMGHEFVGTQHLLLGILREGEGIGCAALAQLGFDIERLHDAVREQVRRLTGDTSSPEVTPDMVERAVSAIGSGTFDYRLSVDDRKHCVRSMLRAAFEGEG